MAKILLVDDDPITLKIVSFVLRAGGHQVSTAPDGFTAFEMVKAEKFQMVITDVNMPGGFSGFRLATAIKKEDRLKQIPVVLLTVRSGKNDVAMAQKCGADHYFIKPIQPDPFREKITEILAKSTPATHLGEIPVREKALWTNMLLVTGVSERGVRLESPVPLPQGYEFCFASNVFHSIGITTPIMRVLSCEPAKTGGEGFQMQLEFAGLSLADVQTVRTWLNKNKTQKSA